MSLGGIKVHFLSAKLNSLSVAVKYKPTSETVEQQLSVCLKPKTNKKRKKLAKYYKLCDLSLLMTSN